MRDRLVPIVFRKACGLLALIVLVADLAFTNASNRYDKTPERVIAIGDVHGDFDDFCLVLKELGLVDSRNIGPAEKPFWCKRQTQSIAVTRGARQWTC